MNLRDQLEAIYEEHGRLTPTLVVEVARPVDHPLHERFEWDDAVAGEAWRRVQAHELIRVVRVVYRPASETGPEQSVRAFHAVRGTDADTFVYEPAERIAEDPLLREMVLRDMEREWKQLHRRFGAFQEFLEMVTADLQVAAA